MEEFGNYHRNLGILLAQQNWIKCRDINGTTKSHKRKCDDLRVMNKHINKLKLTFDMILSDLEMNEFMEQMEVIKQKSMLEHESEIEKEHRPTGIVLNERAIINKTEYIIPDDVKLCLSFGWKFLAPFVTTNENLYEILSQLELCIEESIPELSQHEAFSEISRILRERNDTQEDGTIQWLCFISTRTKQFFATNKDTFATRSDKGGHTVVLKKSEYDVALAELLDEKNYLNLNFNPLQQLIEWESELYNILKKNFKTKELLKGNFFAPKTLLLAKFYGLPKVHKEGNVLRPITVTRGSPGHFTGRIFNRMLNIVFPRLTHHTKDSYEFKKFIDEIQIRENQVLVSFDVVSMYTNIPRTLVKTIIMGEWRKFYDVFGIGKKILEKILDFLLSKCTIFTAIDKIFQQREGLPMGGCISTALARIVMDRVIKQLFDKIPNTISFIRVFVDDTIAAIDYNDVDLALNTLNNFDPQMKFTHEIENQQGRINFLNLTLFRDGNRVRTNWFRKPFASGRLLNFYSSHKRSTIVGTAENFIRTVLELSDPEFFHSNKPVVFKTLLENNFPETLIEVLLNNHYTFMKGKKAKNEIVSSGEKSEKKPPTKYVLFPHSTCQSRKIKGVLHRLKNDNIVLAESTRNTKINYVTTRKVPTKLEDKTNVIVIAKCVCGQKFKFTHTKFNETGQMAAGRLITISEACNMEHHAFRRIKYHKGHAYANQTDHLLK